MLRQRMIQSVPGFGECRLRYVLPEGESFWSNNWKTVLRWLGFGLAVLIIVLGLVVNANCPTKQVSTATGRVVSVELPSGKMLYPGQPGFENAARDAEQEWVK